MRPVHGSPLRRLFAALLLAALAGAPAAASETSWVGLSLSAALDRLREGGLEIVYSTRLVRPEMSVVGEPAAETPEGRMRELLAPHGLAPRWQAAGWWVVVAARPTALAGRIVRAGEATPVAGATVTIEALGVSAVSDATGRFVLPAVGRGPHTLRVSADGFAGLTARYAGAEPLVLPLTPIPVARDEIFVTTTDRRLLDVTARVLHTEPLEKLQKTHFVARVGGRRQRVVSAELLAPEASDGGSRTGSGGSEPQLILLLFDRGLGSAAAFQRAKELALEILSPQPGRRELIAVASLAERAGPWLESSFTSDRSFARSVVSRLRLGDWRPPGGDPLRIAPPKVTANPSSEPQTDSTLPSILGGGAGGKHNHHHATTLESDNAVYAYRGQQASHRRRGRQLSRLDRIILLADELASVAGSKHLLFFSDETDESVALGGEAQGFVDADDVWRLDTEARFPSSAYLARHHRLEEALRAADASFTLIELGDPLEPSSLSGYRGLAQVADATGGLTLERPRELRPALDRLLASPASRYRLTLELDRRATSEIWSRGLDVALRKAPAGARLFLSSHRAAGPRTPFGSRLALAGLVLSGEDGGDFGTAIHAVPLAADADGGPAWVTMELTGLAGLLAEGDETVPIDVYVYAFAPGGEVADYLAQHLELDVERVEGSGAERRLRLLGRLDLPPGELLLRMVALGGRRGEHSLASFALSMPAAGDEILLLGPLLSAADRDVPTLLAAHTSLPDTPCQGPILSGAAFSGAAPRLDRSASPRVLLLARNLPGSSRVLGRLEPEDGPMRPTEAFSLKAVASCPDQGLTLLAGRLPVAARAGRYNLSLTVEAPDADRHSSRSAALHILD